MVVRQTRAERGRVRGNPHGVPKSDPPVAEALLSKLAVTKAL